MTSPRKLEFKPTADHKDCPGLSGFFKFLETSLEQRTIALQEDCTPTNYMLFLKRFAASTIIEKARIIPIIEKAMKKPLLINPAHQILIGKAYEEGLAVEKNLVQATHHYLSSAIENNLLTSVMSKFALGNLYIKIALADRYNRYNRAENLNIACKYFDDIKDCHSRRIRYNDGLFDNIHTLVAEATFLKSEIYTSSLDNPNLNLSYPSPVVEFFTGKAIELGCKRVLQRELSLWNQMHIDLMPDNPKYDELYRRSIIAAENGCIDAIFVLSRFIWNMGDREKSIYYCQIAADRRQVHAISALAYYFDIFVRNENKSLYFSRKETQHGDTLSEFNLPIFNRLSSEYVINCYLDKIKKENKLCFTLFNKKTTLTDKKLKKYYNHFLINFLKMSYDIYSKEDIKKGFAVFIKENIARLILVLEADDLSILKKMLAEDLFKLVISKLNSIALTQPDQFINRYHPDEIIYFKNVLQPCAYLNVMKLFREKFVEVTRDVFDLAKVRLPAAVAGMICDYSHFADVPVRRVKI